MAFLTSLGGGGRNGKGGLRYRGPNTVANYPDRREALLRALEGFVG